MFQVIWHSDLACVDAEETVVAGLPVSQDVHLDPPLDGFSTDVLLPPPTSLEGNHGLVDGHKLRRDELSSKSRLEVSHERPDFRKPVARHRSIGDWLRHLEVALDLSVPLLRHHSPKPRSVVKPSVRLPYPQHLNPAWLQSVVDGDADGQERLHLLQARLGPFTLVSGRVRNWLVDRVRLREIAPPQQHGIVDEQIEEI